MEDRLQFKAWNYKWESWMEDFQISNDGCWLYHEADHWIIGDEVELVQSAGLKDKNGKLIYEGDVAQCVFCNRLISFKDGGFGWESVSGVGLVKIDQLLTGKIEIIGNKFENPELLSKNE